MILMPAFVPLLADKRASDALRPAPPSHQAKPTGVTNSKTIMLIHGAWLNAHSWESFKARYEARGYTVIALSWPLDDRSPAELMREMRQ